MSAFALLMSVFWGAVPLITATTGEPISDTATAVFALIGSLWFIFALYIWHDTAKEAP